MLRGSILTLLLLALGSAAVIRYNNFYQKPLTTAPISSISTGINNFSVIIGKTTRPYALYVPATYKRTVPTPVVFFFHGGGGDMNQAQRYNLQDTADKNGFVIAFLNGASALPDGKLATWNAGNCCGYARDNNSDDVGYVKVVLADINKKIRVNPGMIFATGMSNGALMSYRLACEMSDTFAAIAPVAGTDNTITCKPTQPVSVLHIHALDDDHVLFNGGAGPGIEDDERITDFTSVPETIDRWLKYDKIVAKPERTLSVKGAYCDTYNGANKATVIKGGGVVTGTSSPTVTLCVTETGGHSWPGSHFLRKDASQAIDANTVIWDFFSTHHR